MKQSETNLIAPAYEPWLIWLMPKLMSPRGSHGGEDVHRTPRSKSGTKKTWFDMMKEAESVGTKLNQENDGQDRTQADVEGKVNETREEGEMEMDMETKWGTTRRDQRGHEHEENHMIDLNAARGENSMIIHQAHLPRPPFSRPTPNISLQPKRPHDTIQSPPRRVIDQVITIPPYHDTPHQLPSLADYP